MSVDEHKIHRRSRFVNDETKKPCTLASTCFDMLFEIRDVRVSRSLHVPCSTKVYLLVFFFHNAL